MFFYINLFHNVAARQIKRFIIFLDICKYINVIFKDRVGSRRTLSEYKTRADNRMF